jgi:hypothetical protein
MTVIDLAALRAAVATLADGTHRRLDDTYLAAVQHALDVLDTHRGHLGTHLNTLLDQLLTPTTPPRPAARRAALDALAARLHATHPPAPPTPSAPACPHPGGVAHQTRLFD